MSLSETEILEIFKNVEALLEGHFLLTSGRHVMFISNAPRFLQYPAYMKKICSNIVEYFKKL